MIKFLLNTFKLVMALYVFTALFSLFGYVSYSYYFTNNDVHWMFSVSPFLCVSCVGMFCRYVYEVKMGIQ